MSLGALVAALGALFLGEYEFNELLPILSGALLGLIVAEIVVSVGRLRTLPLALMVAAWSATAVVLAGMRDANDTEPIKTGAYLSAGLAALAALARVNRWRRGAVTATDDRRATAEGDEPEPEETSEASPDPSTKPAAAEDPWAGHAWAADPWVEDTPPPAPTRARRPAPADAPPDLPAAPTRARTRTARRIDPPEPPADQPRPQPQNKSTRVRATARRRPRTDRGR